MDAARQLTPIVIGLVLVAGVLHAVWNAIASQISDRVLAFGLLGLSETGVAVVGLLIAGLPRGAAVPFAVGSMAVHIVYVGSLLRSYQLGGFGRAYPLARGTAPLLVAVGAWFLADEHLSALQIAGVATVAGGLLAIMFVNGAPGRAEWPAIAAALLTGVTIAGYTVLDGLGARRSANPAGYLCLVFVAQGPVIAAVAYGALRRRTAQGTAAVIPGADVRAGLIAGVLSMAAYGIVVWAQTRSPLALVSALRETSVISAALISTLIFREPLARRRIGPAVAVVAGIILISA